MKDWAKKFLRESMVANGDRQIFRNRIGPEKNQSWIAPDVDMKRIIKEFGDIPEYTRGIAQFDETGEYIFYDVEGSRSLSGKRRIILDPRRYDIWERIK
jgi:hypothetical protein